jgi:hypothetical protein
LGRDCGAHHARWAGTDDNDAIGSSAMMSGSRSFQTNHPELILAV